MSNNVYSNGADIGWYSYDFIFNPKEAQKETEVVPKIPERRCENCRLRDTNELFKPKAAMIFCCNDMKYYDWYHTCMWHKNWTIKKGRLKRDGDP